MIRIATQNGNFPFERNKRLSRGHKNTCISVFRQASTINSCHCRSRAWCVFAQHIHTAMEGIDEGTINHDNFKWIFRTRIHTPPMCGLTLLLTQLTHRRFTIEMGA